MSVAKRIVGALLVLIAAPTAMLAVGVGFGAIGGMMAQCPDGADCSDARGATGVAVVLFLASVAAIWGGIRLQS
ncbi:hypothetical protein ACFQ4O_15440 [Methylopila musalis]|uniref:Uncharacterized protein n=1 Tax=Methylopila musalis TaxID=1134781 RepID=A0ABW3ZC44_9HYPH